jgi:glycosyltransferase involved in cell wall biosynthesis
MILFDAVYINSGGGKILLDCIIRKVIEGKRPFLFLLDNRLRDSYPILNEDQVIYIRPSLRERLLFYKKNRDRFTGVYTFANMSPPIKLNCATVTYFHNALFFDPFKQPINWKIRTMQFIKQLVIRRNIRNTDIWVVQTKSIRNKLATSWKIKKENILCLPIYEIPDFEIGTTKLKKVENLDFLYVSTGEAHKNHLRLFDAFKIFNKRYPNAILRVTIGPQYKQLCRKILQMQNEGVNLVNEGFVDRKKLETLYNTVTCSVYPSLVESFGLGLIESAICNLPVIASDFPYVYDVINPTLTFDPYSVESIVNAFELVILKLDNPAEVLAQNCINDFFKLLDKG